MQRAYVRILRCDFFLRHTAGPDHAPGAQVERLAPSQDARNGETTVEFGAFVPTRVGNH